MKKNSLNLLGLAFLFIMLISGCKKTEEPVVQATSAKDVSKMFAAGKIKADELALQFSDPALKLKLPKPGNESLKRATVNTKSSGSLKNGTYPGQCYRAETYTSTGALQRVDYYIYDSYSRLYEEYSYLDLYSNGNWKFNGVYYYTYFSGLNSGIGDLYLSKYYDGNFVNVYNYEYMFVQRVSSIDPYSWIRLGEITRTDQSGKSLYLEQDYTSIKEYATLPNSTAICFYGPTRTVLSYTNYIYEGFNVIHKTMYGANSSATFNQDYTYDYTLDSGGRLTSSFASGTYNAEQFTYVYFNPDLVCYSELKSDGSFQTARVYRYDPSLNGAYFDPLNPIDPIVLGKF